MFSLFTRHRTIALFAILGFAATSARGQSDYTPHKVPPPAKDAEYILPDGTIYIAGNDLIEPLLEKINAVFAESHPGFKFKMDLISSGIAVAGVTSGKSAFGPTARDVSRVEKQAFISRFGYEPLDILVGWDNNPDVEHVPPSGKFPPGVWVNTANPTPALSLGQLASILLSGSPKGDITRWSQINYHEGPVGNNGADYAKRAIHIYMPILHDLPVVTTTRDKLGANLQWSPRVEYLPSIEDVMNAVANDPFGIGFAGWFPVDVGWDRQSEYGSKVRLLPLSVDEDSRVSHGGQGDLYPLTGGLHFLINRAPGKPVEPWIKEYMELLLSKQGQEIISGLMKTDGFLPLDPEDIPKERAKLSSIHP